MIASLVTIVLFAWVARALLGARELTWRRLALAALLGIAVGDGIALTLVWDFQDPQAIDYAQLRTISLPFQVIATMRRSSCSRSCSRDRGPAPASGCRVRSGRCGAEVAVSSAPGRCHASS